MKKTASFLLVIIIILSLGACGSAEAPELPKKSELAVNMDVAPLQPYGNQCSQYNGGLIYFFEDENTVYAAGYYDIFKFSPDDPGNAETIYGFEDEPSIPGCISVMGDWIYYISEDYITDEYTVTYLNRMKKDGSEKTKLASDVNA